MSEKVKADAALLESIAVTQNSFRDTMEHWTEGLVNIAAVINEELAQLGMEDFGYPSDESLQPSAKLSLFFKGVATASSGSGRGSRSSWPTSRAKSAPGFSRRC